MGRIIMQSSYSNTEECNHEWGPVERSHIAGTPHRKCLWCKMVTLDLYDNEECNETDS